MTVEKGFRDLVEMHRHRIFNLCCYYLGPSQDAEDVAQEVLVRLWRNLDRVDEKALSVWLARVTRNLCLDLLRKKKRDRGIFSGDGFEAACEGVANGRDDPRAALEERDLRRQILLAMQGMEEPYRGILILREIQEMSYGEIGEALGLPLNTVRVYLHRARKRLRDEIREKVTDGEF